MQWYTLIRYVDLDTGEIIPKEIALKDYTIIRKIKHIKKVEKTDKYGHINIIAECRRKPTQHTLF